MEQRRRLLDVVIEGRAGRAAGRPRILVVDGLGRSDGLLFRFLLGNEETQVKPFMLIIADLLADDEQGHNAAIFASVKRKSCSWSCRRRIRPATAVLNRQQPR